MRRKNTIEVYPFLDLNFLSCADIKVNMEEKVGTLKVGWLLFSILDLTLLLGNNLVS